MPGQRAVISRFADAPPEAIEACLSLEAQPVPDLASLGPRDVLVAVRSAAVGWVDLLMTSGKYQHLPTPPYCPGLEYAGEVAWTGAEVDATKLSPGTKVLVDGFTAGPRSSGAYQAYGGFASWAVAPVEAVLPVPGTLSLDQAANLLGNYETAFHCLVTRGRLKAEETVLIHGASGSTGLAAVHVAKLVGARVIATGRSQEKLAVVKAQGADEVLAIGGPGGVRPFRDEVKALTGGEGVDVVYDGVGGDVSVESFRCVKFGARFLVVGWAATPMGARPLPTNLIMMKGLDVLGCPTIISSVKDPKSRPPRLAQVLAWAAAGKISPLVSRTFPLDQVKEAMRAKWKGEAVGGIVLHP